MCDFSDTKLGMLLAQSAVDEREGASASIGY